MKKTLKFLKENAWIVSDLHWHHNKDFIYSNRGYSSIQDQDKDIIYKINLLVKHDDILLDLGDMCLNTSEGEFEGLISSINCQNIYHLWGNHTNPGYKIYQQQIEKQYGVNDVEIYPLKYKNIIFVGDYIEIKHKGQEYICSHYPMKSWNSMSHGSIHCHGHIHSKNEKSEGKSIDVGWDAFGKPLKLEEVNEIMKSKPVMHEGHH